MMPLYDVPVLTFLIVTGLLAGGAAWMTGRAIALTWRPTYQLVLYGILLAATSRFIYYALFEGELLALLPFLADVAILIGVCFLAYRFVRARQMVAQYPWLYERAGPLGFRDKR